MVSLRDELVEMLDSTSPAYKVLWLSPVRTFSHLPSPPTHSHAFPRLLSPSLQVLIYSGQLDVIIGAALTETFLPAMPWHGQAAYNAASKSVWRIHPSDTEVAGYARVVGNFSQVVVRAAGHIVPGDQPERALDMISRFVEGRGYDNLPNPKPP